MSDLSPIRELIDLANDAYCGAPDSPTRHWGSVILRAERTLDSLARGPSGASSVSHPLSLTHEAGGPRAPITPDEGERVARMYGSLAGVQHAQRQRALVVDDPGPAVTEDGFSMYGVQGKRADQVEFSGRVVFWCAVGLFALAVGLFVLAVALIAGA